MPDGSTETKIQAIQRRRREMARAFRAAAVLAGAEKALRDQSAFREREARKAAEKAKLESELEHARKDADLAP